MSPRWRVSEVSSRFPLLMGKHESEAAPRRPLVERERVRERDVIDEV